MVALIALNYHNGLGENTYSAVVSVCVGIEFTTATFSLGRVSVWIACVWVWGAVGSTRGMFPAHSRFIDDIKCIGGGVSNGSPSSDSDELV